MLYVLNIYHQIHYLPNDDPDDDNILSKGH